MRTKTYNQLKAKLENLERLLNGGKGSGNFGHFGRPGKRGGSATTPGRSSVAQVASENIAKAQQEEPQVSKDLKNAFKSNNASFGGFDFRIKGRKSLTDKIDRDLTDDGKEYTDKNIKDYASKIHDNLRYTAVCDNDTFGQSYKGIMANLKSNGYEVIRVKNTIADEEAPYRGVNTLVKSKTGYIFELQFHTAQSFAVKEKNHKDYETVRDKDTPKSEKLRLSKIMAMRAREIETPKGADKIKPLNKMGA